MARKKSWKEIQFKDALWSVNKVKGNIEEGMKMASKILIFDLLSVWGGEGIL